MVDESRLQPNVFERESESESSAIENSEKEKTAEEKRQENVHRMTEKARFFIAGKKAKNREEELKQQLGEKAEKENPEQKDEKDGSVLIIEEEAERKKGFIEKIRDRLRLNKLEKAGLSDPQKALEFYEFLKEKFKVEDFNRHTIYIIKESFAATNDPITFYQELAEIAEISSPIDPNMSSYGFNRLMKDPNYAQKINLWKNICSVLQIKQSDFSYGEAEYFLRDDELLSELTPENLGRIKRIREIYGERIGSIHEIRDAVSIVTNDDMFQKIEKLYALQKERGIGKPSSPGFLANDLEKLEKSGMAGKYMQGVGLGMDIDIIRRDLLVDYDERRKENEGKMNSFDLENLSKDEKFNEFSHDFSVLQDRNYNLEEFKALTKLYEYYRTEALAFFEAFSELGIIQKDSFEITRFYDVLGKWKNSTGYSNPDAYQAVLDPQFKGFIKWVEGKRGKQFETDDKLNSSFIFSQEKDIIEKMKTSEGEKLFEFLMAKDMDPFPNHHYRELFKYPGIAGTFQALDKYFVIDGHHVLDSYINLHKESLASGLVSFLDKINISEKEEFSKFGPLEVEAILRMQKNAETFYQADQETLKKHFDFYCYPDVLQILEKDPDAIKELDLLAEDGFLDSWQWKHMVINNFDTLVSIPREKRKQYIEIIDSINDSPSQEIQKIRNELIAQLVETPNPEEAYRKIENIFIKNNLPLVGKVFKIFATLHPQHVMEGAFKTNDNLSPYLTEAKSRKRYMTIYSDLINIHIKSGNRSLRDYLQTFQKEENGENIFDMVDKDGVGALGPDEIKRLEFLLKRAQTLFENSQKGGRMSPDDLQVGSDIENQYLKLRDNLGVKDGERITDRISQMFLAPTGFSSIDEALKVMKNSKKAAHERGLSMAEEAVDEKLEIGTGDLLKGVKAEYIANIMQNGSVATEYLGASSSKDATPFDTDVSRVMTGDLESGFSGAINNSLASDSTYGSLLFCVKDRGQWQETSNGNGKNYDQEKLELFQAGKLGEKHYGIRTGFPSSEIDFMIAKPELTANQKKIENIYFEIAKNGWYIPVTDTEGKIIFTPQMYEEYRKVFAGLENFEGSHLEFEETREGDRNFEEISQMMQELPQDRENVTEIKIEIRNAINEVLGRHGVKLKEAWDTSIIGAEILDTGSTARHTNAPSDFDFDLILRLDNADMKKVSAITQELKTIFQGADNESHGDADGGYQLRLKNATGIGGAPMDIDVGFVKKSELVQFGSHDAVEEKLNWIKNNIGNDAYEQTVANVILTKKVLKEGEAYKKLEHGGIGGIGVENWILGNGGNMVKAFETFYQAAHNEDGQVVGLEEFRQKYRILDPGINVKFNSHDNFVSLLKEGGYQAMLKTIDTYLKK